MSSSTFSPSETILIDLVHDLRQHLGNIQTSVYCLSLLSDSTQTRTQDLLGTIEQQVARASRRLSEAGAEMTRLRAQPAAGEEILALTKSATSAVT
jgi:K+-sensing histidine kinase KdpD